MAKLCLAILFLFAACLVQSQAAGYEKDDGKKHILVFGGSGFVGSATVAKFIERDYKVHLVSRGNWYWDSEDRIRPFVDHVFCDREGNLEKHCPDFMELLKSVSKFEAVIDFSAFGEHEVNQSTRALESLTDLYVLLSTDAIYDVSRDKSHEHHLMEHDAVRPDEVTERDQRRFYYLKGHNRKEAEEALEAANIPYYILRLPDVVGPRDTTNRFWIYQLWLRLAVEMKDHHVPVPDFLHDYPMSLVYSEDVAHLIVQLLHYPADRQNHAYNLAWEETFTMHDLLESIQRALGIAQGDFRTHKGEGAFWMYPTIRRGPLNVTKAQEQLNWSPTPWQDAITDTVQFYETAFKDETFQHNRNEIIQVVEGVVFSNKPKKDRVPYYEILERIYNVQLHHFKPKNDEL